MVRTIGLPLKTRGSRCPEWVRAVQGLLEPKFADVSGKVFVISDKAHLARYRRRFASQAPDTCDENTDNHEHFGYFDGTTVEGVRRNYALAQVVRLAWLDALERKFPGRGFRLFVSNEYYVDPEETNGDELGIDTVLRLWSLPATSKDFDRVYRPNDATMDKVLWLEFSDDGLLQVDEVLRIIAKGAKHPKIREAVRRRRSDAI